MNISSSIPTQTIDAKNAEAWSLRDENRSKATHLAQTAFQIAKAQDYTLGVAQSLGVISFISFRRNQFARALTEAMEALTLWEYLDDKSWLPKIYNTIAVTYGAIGERKLSIEYLQKQLELCHHLGDRVSEASAYNNIALEEPSLDQAIYYFEKALAIFAQEQSHQGEVLALLNMADRYHKVGQHFDLALSYTQKALELSELYGGIERGYGLKISGDNYYHQQHYQEALSRYEQALDSIDDEPSLAAETSLAIGDCYQALQNPELALMAFKEALDICESTDYKIFLHVCHQKLAGLYKMQGNLEKALEHFETYHQLKERMFHETSEQKTQSFEVVRQVIQQTSEMHQDQNHELKSYVLELEQLRQEYKELNLRDPLTNLYNRSYLFAYFDKHQPNSRLSIAILDLDHFTSINESYGFSVGDSLLKIIAILLQDYSKKTDCIARLDSDSFVMVFPELSLGKALTHCEALRQHIIQNIWSYEYPELKLTLSIGLVEGLVKDYEKLLFKADQKLYEAKRSGRNCVKI